MAEHQGTVDDALTYAAFGVPVHVGAANADRADLDEDLSGTRDGHRAFLELNVAGTHHNGHRSSCHRAYRSPVANQRAPGWYGDPDTPGRWRWWDGRSWTEHAVGADQAGGTAEMTRPGPGDGPASGPAAADAPTLHAAGTLADAPTLHDGGTLADAPTLHDGGTLADAPTLHDAGTFADAGALDAGTGLHGAATVGEAGAGGDAGSSIGARPAGAGTRRPGAASELRALGGAAGTRATDGAASERAAGGGAGTRRAGPISA